MFKTVKRKIATADICLFNDESESLLIENSIVHNIMVSTERSEGYYVKDARGLLSEIRKGDYIAREPIGLGYYPISATTAESIYDI